MIYTLICLLKHGVPLSAGDLANVKRFTGNLVVEDWIQGGSFGRPVRQARLLSTTHGANNDLLAPLFEPVLLKMTDMRMTLQGYEVQAGDGGVRYCRQDWLIKNASENESS